MDHRLRRAVAPLLPSRRCRRGRRASGRALLAVLALIAAAATALALDEELKTIPTRPGVTQSFRLIRPDGAPVAGVLLFSGGDGKLELANRGPDWIGSNFLVRNRQAFASHRFLVALVDAPSDRAQAGLDGFRTSREHAQDIGAVIAALRAMAPVPVWVVGTSMGSVSAASVAARLGPAGPDGVVLTSSVTRRNKRGESVNDVDLTSIRVPTLIVHHQDDPCPSTRYGDAVLLGRALKNAPKRGFRIFEGGEPARSAPCEPFSAHGFVGLDAQVVKAIADWIIAPAAK